MAGAERWNPWAALRERAATLLEWQRSAGGRGHCEVRPDGTEVIVLDPRLRYVDRRAVLGHELVHLERGLLPDGTPSAVREREEHQVEGVTAVRFIPLELLVEFGQRCEYSPLTVDDVAAEFEVPRVVAERALAQLRHPRSAGLRRQMSIDEEGAA